MGHQVRPPVLPGEAGYDGSHLFDRSVSANDRRTLGCAPSASIAIDLVEQHMSERI